MRPKSPSDVGTGVRPTCSILALLVVILVVTLACTRDGDRKVDPEPKLAVEVHPAVGSLEGLSAAMIAALADTPQFAPLRDAGPGDWLSTHDEPGQTVAQFTAKGPSKPTAERSIIYLQPIGPFPSSAPALATLARYTEVFFALEVAVLEPITAESLDATSRESDYGRQLRTDDVLAALERRLPADGFLLVGLTMEDLYPSDEWNYVFGFASFSKRVAVYSLLRFDPMVFNPKSTLDVEQRRDLMLRRSVAIMSHELTHSFGMRHCVHHDCVMNGANSLHEVDLHPLHLCPVCLRKLHVALGFDPVDRYEQLGAFYADHGLHEQAAWIESRLEFIRSIAGP
jgi:archaemetzincin